jgi:histidinol-phosphate aminotransferase
MQQDELRYEQSPLNADYTSKTLVRMNQNENLVLPENFVRSIVAKCIDEVDARLYPSDQDKGEFLSLRSEIGKYCGCSENSVALGVGADQCIDLLLRATIGRSSNCLATIDPTFSMYELLASRSGIKTKLVRTRGSKDKEGPFSLETKEIISVCNSSRVKMLALASPNNPTGIQYPLEQVKEILESLKTVTVLLDEAYVEYSDYSASRLLSSFPNLVIVRTFSKAFGLASFRIGYVTSSDLDFIRSINETVQYPLPLTTLSAKVATAMLRRKESVIECAEKTKLFRVELISALQKMKGLRVIPDSKGNFVLVQSDKSFHVARELLSKYAIALKYIANLGREKEFLRITVGSRELNQKLLYALRRILS